MYLPQTAEYALRAMTYMANLPPETAVRARDLSQATTIPSHYLSKVLRRLVLAGLLTSQRGHGGGFCLAREPHLIRFLDIMVALDFRPDPSRCSFGWGSCDPSKPCPLHSAWSRLNSAFCAWAAETTLATVLVTGGLPDPASDEGKNLKRTSL